MHGFSEVDVIIAKTIIILSFILLAVVYCYFECSIRWYILDLLHLLLTQLINHSHVHLGGVVGGTVGAGTGPGVISSVVKTKSNKV